MPRIDHVDPAFGATSNEVLNARGWNEMNVLQQNGTAASLRLPVYAKVAGTEAEPQLEIVDHINAELIGLDVEGEVHATRLKLSTVASGKSMEYAVPLPLEALVEQGEERDFDLVGVVRWRVEGMMSIARMSQNPNGTPPEQVTN